MQELLQSKAFSIDEYQREYKWEKENIDELLFDLQNKFLSSYKPGEETTLVGGYAEYFLGSIIVSNRAGRSYLVDGQQRVTSLTLLLIALYRATKDKGLGVHQTIAPLIFSDNLGQPKFNLDISERLPVIEALFKGKPFNGGGSDESIQTMAARYRDIVQSELWDEIGEALPHFAYWLMTRVGLIEIVTDSDNQAYAIFETMNDRGKPLSPVDMLKAYLLAPITDEAVRRRVNDVWKHEMLSLNTWAGSLERERDAQFIKAWLRAQHSQTIRERVAGSTDKDWELIGTVFHRWVRDHSQALGIGSAAANAALMEEQMRFFARAYRLVLDASSVYTQGLEAVFYNAHNDFTWQSTVLLAPLVATDDDQTVRQKLAITATYLDIWLMRRVVNYIRVGYSSTSYAMWLLCRDIRRKSVPELVAVLAQKLDEDDVRMTGSPSRGRTGIAGLALNQFSRRYIFHLLARVTAAVEEGSGRTARFDQLVDRSVGNPFDIEHIWANDFAALSSEFANEQQFAEWRDRVASLLLLPADVNRSLQDKLFSEKREKYALQNFYAASLHEWAYSNQPKFAQFRAAHGLEFTPVAHFGKAEQQQRQELLLALAEQIWSPARLTQIAP